MSAVVTPIIAAAMKIFTSIRAKVMPTAKASMLVATARSSMDLKPKEALSSCCSLEKPSLSIFPPMRHSSTKATQ